MRNYHKMDTNRAPQDPIKARYWADKKARMTKPTPLQILILRALGMPTPVAHMPARNKPSGGGAGSRRHRQWKKRRAAGWDRRDR